MPSKRTSILIAIIVIGLLLLAGIAIAKPGHGLHLGKSHVVHKEGKVRVNLITGKVSIEASSTVCPDHVHLRLVSKAEGRTVRAVQTKKDGTYRFKNLKLVPGDYSINAWAKKSKVLYSGETTITIETSGSVSGDLNFTLKSKN